MVLTVLGNQQAAIKPHFEDTTQPSARRSVEFWVRASGIYFKYKQVQLKAYYVGMVGYSSETIEKDVWIPQHRWAGEQMYKLFVDLKGFYIKVGTAGNFLLNCSMFRFFILTLVIYLLG